MIIQHIYGLSDEELMNQTFWQLNARSAAIEDILKMRGFG